MNNAKIIWTIGHSTRPFEDFISLLTAFQINHVINIRRYPGSKRFPHYNKEILTSSLEKKGFKYTHLEALGGRRNPMPDSVNTAWRVKGFRGYADYMQTSSFKNSILQLEKIALAELSVFMCTEAVWWSCHRSLVSDYLKVNGWTVMHIMGKDKTQEHPFTKAATVIEGSLHHDISPPASGNFLSTLNPMFL